MKVAIVLVVLAPWLALAVKDKSRSPVAPKDILERQAASSCAPGEFQCGFGECVPTNWVCDTSRDCFSNLDEENCPQDCSGPHQYKCDSGQCIPRQYICDGEMDCNDHSDETHCQLTTSA